MAFCVIPSRYDLHFNQSQNCDSMESVMKEFRELSKSVKPQVYCLPLLGPYCHEIQLTLKKTPS